MAESDGATLKRNAVDPKTEISDTRSTVSFGVALALYTVGSLAALGFALGDEGSDTGTIAGAAAFGIVTAVILWSFARRGHRWPKWVLLALVVVGIPALISSLDARSLLVILDVAALVALLRGWSELGPADVGGG